VKFIGNLPEQQMEIEMKFTLSAEGSINDIRQLIDAFEVAGIQNFDLNHDKKTDVEAFVQGLNWNGKKTVGQLVFVLLNNQNDVALEDRHITRQQWQAVSGVGDDEFNGVLGSIGRAWAKHSDEPNPFVSQGTDKDGNHVHGIQDGILLHDLFELVATTAQGE
jgi:hypothetical protein